MTKQFLHRTSRVSSHDTLVAWFLLFLLTIALCGNVLFSQDQIFGASNTDIAQQFIAWRHFGFAELVEGRLPLWNPHIFGGAPYFGGFQSALMYPLNWPLFMVLETRTAINLSVTLHCFLMGAFTYHWLRQTKFSQMAALMAGGLTMLSGTYVTHIYAGHLPNLCAMVWLPLILLAVDGMLSADKILHPTRSRQILFMTIGAVAIALQVLAGHPQYVLISAIAVTGYALMRVWRAPSLLQTISLLALMASLGGALAAVQLIPGMAATAETIRSRALPESFAAMFSLPTENLLTLVFPKVFGGIQPESYFGRWYFWEVCLYIGSSALLLSLLGISKAAIFTRGIHNSLDAIDQQLGLMVMGAMALLIALGASTPLHHYLYVVVPGFDRIRGVSKFAFVLTPVIAYFAAQGYDRLDSLSAKWLAWCSVVFSCVAFALAYYFQKGFGLATIEWISASKESYFLEAAKQQMDAATLTSLQNQMSLKMAGAFWRGGLELLTLAGLLILVCKKIYFKPIVAIIVVLQLFIWAEGVVVATSFREQTALWEMPSAAVGHEYRVANQTNKNSGMYSGAMDISGNDPSVTTRYAELMAAIEGKDPNAASQYIEVTQPHPLHVLLRLKYVKQLTSNGTREWLYVQEPAMPRFALVDSYSLREGRDAVLSRMLESNFDPTKEVVMEQMPSPVPEIGAKGLVRVLKCQTDSCRIDVSVDKPALLLMTDAWTPSWRVRAESVGSASAVQTDYTMLPGNHAFRVVPLAAGNHELYIYHTRDVLHMGAVVSAITVVIVLIFSAWSLFCLYRRPKFEERTSGKRSAYPERGRANEFHQKCHFLEHL